ncbi:MAG: acetyl-CoA acetyltransferase [Novosphingobium sp. 63-713]|uniref:acetyl-CoA C-acetyltransferase n=1 Tax=unclassified Novosphingobium TaxID=2644732 RepID=UPI00086EFDE1|nr:MULTISPECIES: acetyl-CoA C-acetyltransferase [unclassified Novosphingobium]MBN9145148.1 acetyl-CoA C-acetyltransferase [Novosphingobium sp.]MDR6709069.1 acetyl-CoA C-acetyltransferase [Novosphingobium sp. 1748]ODU70905.1 MAG: acetyl-CoA acetyltransferase [Novosphingobium sp. SCN 66-18]OJX89857.1 MAG: acetyl-CoA acetyltransferase [Novosphingobium sp. 63-713]
MAEAYIVAVARSAGGKRGGRLAGVHPADLAGRVLAGLIDRAGADPHAVEDVIMGCACPGGEQGANIARNAVLAGGLPESVPGTHVDRQCGSSQQAVHFAAATVMAGVMDVVIAAGVESMTRVPMGLPWTLAAKHGFGTYRSPGIEARYPDTPFSQFGGAEMLAKKYGLTRDVLDAYALESHRRAAAATAEGKFDAEIIPLEVVTPEGETVIHKTDEGIRADASLEKISSVKLLTEGGVISAANASQICDGAAAVLVVNERGLKALGLKPLARIHQMTVLGHDPVIMLEAPIPATQRALAKAGMGIGDIDLYEVNEAFAPVPLAWAQALNADAARMNVHGGAIALGHPLGGSGAKLMSTLVSALHSTGGRYGLQTMCEAGGMANVTIVERL